MTPKRFQKIIWEHYEKNKRSFPWRKTHDAYAILVSEIMLQQTQTERVVPKYETWLKHFPTFKALSQTPLQKVLTHWHGLGYNRRALALKRAAQKIVADYNGKLPADYEKILELPGIGPYTAGAIMAFAFNKPRTFIETNIRTVYIHFFTELQSRKESRFVATSGSRVTPSSPAHGQIHDKELLPLIEKTLDTKNPREWYYALMDYGVMLKKTLGNLNVRSRHYNKQSKFKGSHRELRAKVLRLITARSMSEKAIVEAVSSDANKTKRILNDLEKEGFIKRTKGVYCIY